MSMASCLAPVAAASDPPASSDLSAPGAPLAADAVRLGSGEPLVPPELLVPPFREENRGILRDLAAILLDRHLRRLARMRNPVDLRIGRILLRLDQASGFLALGFARLADYAVERLGLTARRARALAAMAHGLEPLPRLAAAYEAGDISRSQVALLLRVTTPDTEDAWLARARRLTVRLLEREVRAALAADERIPGAAAAHPDAAPLDATHPASFEPLVDDDATGEWIDIPIPSRLRPLWDRALELARRSSGSSDPVSACIEMIAADFLAGAPDVGFILAGDPDAATRNDPSTSSGDGDQGENSDCSQAADAASLANDTDLFEEVIRSLEEDRGIRRWAPPGAGFAVVLPDSVEPRPDDAPRTLDKRLRDLVRLRQNVTWHQGRLLRVFVGRRLHRELGFLSFSRYCRERAGLGVRRAWDLISLERRLWLLPRVAEAYRDGTLSWVRAAAIARVATESTESAWLSLARSVTVRRLHEEVAIAQVGNPFRAAAPPGLDGDGRVQLSAPRARTSQAPDAGSQPDGEREDAQTSVAADGWTRLRFWAPHDIATLWHQAIRVARALLTAEPLIEAPRAENGVDGAAEATPPAVWQCAERILESFLQSWSVRADPTWRRHHRIFERDGWRCRVPGCSSRRNLQVHHVVFRSRGGGDEDDNLVVLCAAHHLQGIHHERLRCHALADGLLAWEFAPDDGDEPLARFVEDVEWSAARASLSPRAQGMPVTRPASSAPAAIDC